MYFVAAALTILALIYLSLCGYMYFYQDQLMYFPKSTLTRTPQDGGLVFKDITLITEDQNRIHAWYIPAPDAKWTALFLHGNAGNMSDRIETLQIFHGLKLNILMIDYRGYGKSTGQPSEQGTYQDGEAAWKYLTETRKLLPTQIILIGRSLGSGIATELAVRHPPRALVLESAFTSMPAIAQDVYPIVPAHWIVKHKYDNANKLHAVRCPILLIHSKDDEFISVKHSRKLFQIETPYAQKQLVEIRGSHGGGFLLSGADYTTPFTQFLNALR